MKYSSGETPQINDTVSIVENTPHQPHHTKGTIGKVTSLEGGRIIVGVYIDQGYYSAISGDKLKLIKRNSP